MPISPAQYTAAKQVQHQAAHDPSPQVRLLAGPGTGKSYSIGERVKWLLGNGVPGASIWAISFTNASTDDLRISIDDYCIGVPGIADVRVRTLHSLALSILAKGGKLAFYPVRPRVLDSWEQRHVFDEELSCELGCGIKRCAELRTHFEAKWSTGAPPLPFISSPTQAITPAEEVRFQAFYTRTTQIYSCLLPGEAVRKCIDYIKAGTLAPDSLLGIKHLVVDEYQDLNPADVELVDLLVRHGVVVFVCGDDDQSIYSFRYAYPTGIQGFLQRHPHGCGHALPTCFRCASKVLNAGTSLITQFPPNNRLPKSLTSAYLASSPPVAGQVVGWRFASDISEAKAIASSVSDLIAAGIEPGEILILLSSRDSQLENITRALRNAKVPADVQKDVGLADDTGVRFVYAALRALRDSDDYLALRTLLAVRRGVGIGTCLSIAQVCLAQGLNFADQFGAARSRTLFSTRENAALDGVATVLTAMQGWLLADTLAARRSMLDNIVAAHLTPAYIAEWQQFAALVPQDISLAELLAVLDSRTQRSAREVMKGVYERLGQPVPSDLDPAGRVRIMTLHSCKGLSARVVFIPGLEEEILPGPYRAQYPGQVEEAARLLYVGITRARALCVLSFSRARIVNGARRSHQGSRFLSALGTSFQSAAAGLTSPQVTQALTDCGAL